MEFVDVLTYHMSRTVSPAHRAVVAIAIAVVNDLIALRPQLRNAASEFIKDWGITKLSERLWAFFEELNDLRSLRHSTNAHCFLDSITDT